jgi:glycosyltransferase involved in cell wall biosynthesis
MTNPVVVGIDAARNRSGGAKAHLQGILGAADPSHFGISRVHVWSYRGLLDSLPDRPWLVKHAPDGLQGSLLGEVWWQWTRMRAAFRAAGCDVTFSLGAGTVGRVLPQVVMSRDMTSFEPTEIVRFGISRARARLILLRWLQVSSLRSATGVIFLTRYAAERIQQYTGPLAQIRIIPHGVGENFRSAMAHGTWPADKPRIEVLYVSNTDMYKHQWHVVRALGKLRRAGMPVHLKLVGGGSGRSRALTEAAIAEVDPCGEFIEFTGAVSHAQVPAQLAKADLFIFASSCENMPNTLVEAMASGLPIACSNRGPMPEVLEDAGVFFDPESPDSIAAAVERLILDQPARQRMAEAARQLAASYSWERCARETWSYLADVARQVPAAT